ncbi:MAG: ubiquinone biosynthesis protein UbiA [Bacteroidetes bacterium]|nr:MAG: ubiquinone biosynthesis protein UbiA [Bacteroidota bacterium]
MTQYLNQDQRTLLVKFLAYLGLVRWYNLLLIALAQYLASIFLLNKGEKVLHILADPGLHAMVLSCSMIIAGGYLINAFYDMEKDLANNPDKLIIGRIISKSFALNTYLLFNFTALAIGLIAGWPVVLFLCAFCFLLWFYSHKLKKITFIGNLTATFLSVCSFFIVCLYYWQLSWGIVLYVVFLVITELIRELVKDLEVIKGDILYGYATVPVAIGIPKTKRLLLFMMLGSLLPVIGVYKLQGWSVVMFFFLFALALLAIAGLLLWMAREKKDYNAVNNLLKFIMVLGVLSIGLV